MDTRSALRRTVAFAKDLVAALTDVISWLDDLLDVAAFEDLGPNGLQVPGRPEVEKVVTGVSGQLELFERAAAARADLVLVHHGIFWKFHDRRLGDRQAARLKTLLAHEMSLAQYHLPLDAHAAVGNNALLADALGAEETGRAPFATFEGRPVGWTARFADPGVPIEELVARVREACGGREPLLQGAGPARVRSIGIVSGGGADALDEAVAIGLDALLTGEPREHVMAEAREAGIHFLAGGHYATETHGIRRLGELVSERFGVDHEFVDIPNPV